MQRVEQLTALVVTVGLAVVSYWLFFSWAEGGGVRDRRPSRQSSEAPAGLHQPLLARPVVLGGQVTLHLLSGHRQAHAFADRHDPAQGARGIL